MENRIDMSGGGRLRAGETLLPWVLSLLLLLLLLSVACWLMPVKFHLSFILAEERMGLRLELSSFGGLLRRTHELVTTKERLDVVLRKRKTRSLWSSSELRRLEPLGLLDRFEDFWTRLDKYGLGGALYSYFIPPGSLRWLHVASWLENKGEFTSFDWRTIVGVGEAAATAWVTGLVWSLKSLIVAYLKSRYFLPTPMAVLRVSPSFTEPAFRTHLDCIFKLRAGYIIRASARGLLLDRLQPGLRK